MDAQTNIITIGERSYTVLKQDQMPDGRSCHVFAIGSKGIPASYGGFESFMDSLTAYRAATSIVYHVARMAQDDCRFVYHNAVVYDVKVPEIGHAKAIYYDIAALKRAIAFCKRNAIQKPVFFIMTCRIGPVMGHFAKQIRALGGRLIINPDGHEWARRKWSKPVRQYWKLSERLMVTKADLLTCDSKNIEKYIHNVYAKYGLKTVYIPYGADVVSKKSAGNFEPDRISTKYKRWLKQNGLSVNGYYLVVARCVPENNFDIIVREFMASDTSKRLAIITTPNDKFLGELDRKYHYSADPRICFLGSVYDRRLLMEIRSHAFAYIHGHEVGGTNPSLLEAMGSTDVNMLFNVCFNEEVAEDSALYWGKEEGSLRDLIHRADKMNAADRQALGTKAKKRISEAYAWKSVVRKYEDVFLGKVGGSS